jgi:small subunit ribosomal protein S30e
MGKVHGSLTRAGKVRKQTPKVEKKERIRKLTVGRAKKRRQYQRRYAILTSDDPSVKKRFKPNKQQVA